MIQVCVGLLVTGPIAMLSITLFASHRFAVSTGILTEFWIAAFGAAFAWFFTGTVEIWRPLFARLPLIGKKR